MVDAIGRCFKTETMKKKSVAFLVGAWIEITFCIKYDKINEF